jgi:hypothetical protein
MYKIKKKYIKSANIEQEVKQENETISATEKRSQRKCKKEINYKC